MTYGLDISPSTRDENLRRLDRALRDVGARRAERRELNLDPAALASQPVHQLTTAAAELKLVPAPPLGVATQRHQVDGALVTVRQAPDPRPEIVADELFEARRVSQPHVVVIANERLLMRRRQLLILDALDELASQPNQDVCDLS